MENIGGQWPWGKWSRQEALSIIIFMLQFILIAPLSNFFNWRIEVTSSV